MQVRENCQSWFHVRDPLQSPGDMRVTGMRRIAQRVNDPAVDMLQRRERLFVETVHVTGIRDRPETVAERLDLAVPHAERFDRNVTPCPAERELFERFGYLVRIQDRRIVAAGRLYEAIAEACHDASKGRCIAIDVDPAAHVHGNHAKIVESVKLVGMVMRDEHGIEMRDACVDQLLAHVGRRVDKHRCDAGVGFPLDKNGAAPSSVLKVRRIAGAPIAGTIRSADARYATRRAATENRDVKMIAHVGGTTLANSRKKLAVVASSSSRALIPLRVASTAAVCLTKAGSLRLPLCGMGAR